MNSTRQDAWSQDEDILLAETVLRYIREGKTQLEAFKEVGKKLSRTPAACGFRWNASIRKQYQQAINVAKKDRKQQADSLSNYLAIDSDQEDGTLDAVISLLEKVKVNYTNDNKSDYIQQEVKQLSEENKVLKDQLQSYENTLNQIKQLLGFVESNKREKTLID